MKISRLGRSLSAAAILTVATAGSVSAQGVRSDSAATHTVKRGDTLWDLAQAYLGDAYLWPEIYRLNTDQIEDPHWIYPGEIQRLPGHAEAVAQTPAVPGDTTRVAQRPPEEEPPRRVGGPTIFAPRVMARPRRSALEEEVPPARVPIGDVIRAPYFDGVGTDASKRPRVRIEVTLNCQYADVHYHPRVCSRSFCAIFDTSSPVIASPNSSLASSTVFGSAK